MKVVTLLVVGAGGRGQGYAKFAKSCPDRARVVGVAEPRDFFRQKLAQEHEIAAENVFDDWRKAAAKPRMADAVLICTQDTMHEEPAIAFAKLGYHVLLEKPMAPSVEACRNIVAAVEETGIIFAVCHVLRYTAFTKALKEILDRGTIGDITSIDHYEPVGFWHQAHSFVRGNWRRETDCNGMLLAKSCHDIDWLSHIMGKPCARVSSFGSLRHFKPSEAPAGAAARCMDCSLNDTCPYSAKRFYFAMLEEERLAWPLDVVDPEMTAETLERALREGPYGRCVYACDNDVVDNQVVCLQYADGSTANFTMTAFNPGGARQTRIGGTLGYIETIDSSVIKHFDYATNKWQEIDTNAGDDSVLGGHGGGDGGLMNAFIGAIATGDRSQILSGAAATLESHLTVFAAEESRRKGIVCQM
ncbi:MAG: Gfo/Idh/MocA family oxidoreductase [Lentisphaerae bacterium]|nr:Gfo/Idh/MocA family oxidoreductase [Lentisphaerota bacterium]